MKILPIIYSDAKQTVTKTYITEQFEKAGLTITNISTDVIGTGTEIKTSDGTTYTVLIYGDIDGDGCVDTFDAGAIIRHYVLGGNYTLTGVYKLATMLDEDEKTDTFDAGKIIQFFVGKRTDLVANKPVSDRENDTKAPVITLNGNSTVRLYVGDTYEDAGATATDDVDGNVTKNIKVSSDVDTSEAGTYTVTYTVTDGAGNVATATRTVKVIEYVPIISDSSSSGGSSNSGDSSSSGGSNNSSDSSNSGGSNNSDGSNNSSDSSNSNNPSNPDNSNESTGSELKDISQISIQPKETSIVVNNKISTVINDEIEFTVKSGENEKAINKDDLSIKIFDADNMNTEITNTSTAKVKIGDADTNGNIPVTFTPYAAGNYKITATVGDFSDTSDEIKISMANVIEIKLARDTATAVALDETLDNEEDSTYNITVNKTKYFTVTFNRKYLDGTIEKDVNVNKGYVNANSLSENCTISLCDASKTEIIDDNTSVKYIKVTPTASEENIKVTITVGETEKSITINAQEPTLSVNGVIIGQDDGTIKLYYYDEEGEELDNLDDIKDVLTCVKGNLYQDEDGNLYKVEEDEEEDETLIYALVPITFGNEQMTSGTIRDNISIKDENDGTWNIAAYVLYKENEDDEDDYIKIESNSTSDIVKYIGIAIQDNSVKEIKIYYKDITDPVVLNVDITNVNIAE